MSDTDERLAALGALAKDVRHETANLLSIAAALTDGARGVADGTKMLEKASAALGRLAALDRALGLCASSLSPPGKLRFAVGELVGHAVALCEPKLRVAGVTVTQELGPVAAAAYAGNPGDVVIALAVLLREAGRAATGKGGTVQVTADAATVTLRSSGAREPAGTLPGLDLALARSLAKAVGAPLVTADAPVFTAELRLPLL